MNLKNYKEKQGQVTLAFGEVTGSFHRVYSDTVEVLEREDNGIAFYISEDGQLKHQDSDHNAGYTGHDMIGLDKGLFVSGYQAEYDPMLGIRRLLD